MKKEDKYYPSISIGKGTIPVIVGTIANVILSLLWIFDISLGKETESYVWNGVMIAYGVYLAINNYRKNKKK